MVYFYLPSKWLFVYNFYLSKEAPKIINSIKHEIMNFIISSASIVLVVFCFCIAVFSGSTYTLSKFIVDPKLIQLGLIPENVINELMIGTGPSYSYVSVNKVLFILLNVVFGFITFKLICKRGTKYSGLIYGIFMTLIFILVASILTIQSGDPFNWICVVFGIPVTLFVQIILATSLLKNNKKPAILN